MKHVQVWLSLGSGRWIELWGQKIGTRPVIAVSATLLIFGCWILFIERKTQLFHFGSAGVRNCKAILSRLPLKQAVF